MSAATTAPPHPGGRPAPIGQRAALVGILTLVTSIAFEALAVSTAMPVVATDLGGLREYGLAFSLFLTTSLFGMVAAGGWGDARGPHGPLLTGLALFSAGSAVCALAPTYPVLLAGRLLAGGGGGLLVVTMYLVIAALWPESARPRVFAWVSAAWVLPGLVGPAVAGALAQHASWRLVFALVLPVVVGAALLLRGPMSAFPAQRTTSAGAHRAADGIVVAPRARLAAGAGLAVGAVAVQWGTTALRPLPLVVAVAGAVLVVVAASRLLPRGSWRSVRGLPSVVGVRGLYTACFTGAEAYLPLMLVTVAGFTPVEAGLELTGAAIGWSFGSYLQGRPDLRVPRHRLMSFAGALVAVMVAALALPAVGLVPFWLAVVTWCVAGVGMGLGMTSTSVLVLSLSAQDAKGRSSSALQLSDALGSVVGISLGGALLALARAAEGPAVSGTAFALVFAVLAPIGLVAAVFGSRVVPARAGRRGAQQVSGAAAPAR